MLDTLKLMQELEKAQPKLFKDTSEEYSSAKELMNWLFTNPDALEFLKKSTSPYLIPQWQGELQTTSLIGPHNDPYQVIAADGSQIYPDKHQGVSCYLINSGVIHFLYGETPNAKMFSVPKIFTAQDDADLSEDMVNCRRAELEFQIGLQESLVARTANPEVPLVFLCDGSLIFWHLDSKSQQIKERFLARYISQLDEFYKERVPIAGYISLPKSKELVSLLRNSVAYNQYPVKERSFDTIVDVNLVSFFLPAGHRTTIFEHNSALADRYPEHLRPHFAYLNIGSEIARIEMPAWVTQDEEMLHRVMSIIVDQCNKGNGYPVAISESHEQAVVKGPEREFFFHMLTKMGIAHNYRAAHSQKSLKKRFVSV